MFFAVFVVAKPMVLLFLLFYYDYWFAFIDYFFVCFLLFVCFRLLLFITL